MDTTTQGESNFRDKEQGGSTGELGRCKSPAGDWMAAATESRNGIPMAIQTRGWWRRSRKWAVAAGKWLAAAHRRAKRCGGARKGKGER